MSLKHLDLVDCVLPEISVDEYESKTGENDEVIVVGLYCIEEDAARDLDDFIEKSSVEVLDVDVSPNPTEDGKYMVFVEIKRAPDFFLKLRTVIEEVENLSGKMDWIATVRGSDHSFSLDDPELDTLVSVYGIESDSPEENNDDEDTTSDMKVPDDEDLDATEDDIDGEDMDDEDYDDVEEALILLNTNSYIAEKVDGKVKLHDIYLEVLDCANEDWIAEAYDHVPMDFSDSYESIKLSKNLGLDWEVTNLRNCVALKHHVTGNVIIARV